MGVTRIVPNFGPADAPPVQLQTVTRDATAPCNPIVSIGFRDPDGNVINVVSHR